MKVILEILEDSGSLFEDPGSHYEDSGRYYKSFSHQSFCI